eukprot:scaffold1372_cov229-Prasinococcus_capsulatus_cf.AAC.1
MSSNSPSSTELYARFTIFLSRLLWLQPLSHRHSLSQAMSSRTEKMSDTFQRHNDEDVRDKQHWQ